MSAIAPKPENLAKLVFQVRGEKVLLDADLADLYGVATKALNQAVKRNFDRFPVDFMFQLTPEEWEGMRSQTVTAYPENKAMKSQTVTASRRKLTAMATRITTKSVETLKHDEAKRKNIPSAEQQSFVQKKPENPEQIRHLGNTNLDLQLVWRDLLRFGVGMEMLVPPDPRSRINRAPHDAARRYV